MANPLYDALFLRHLSNSGHFQHGDTGQAVSYRDFFELSAELAHMLVAAGVAPGDRTVVQAPKRVETFALYAATLQIGAV